MEVVCAPLDRACAPLVRAQASLTQRAVELLCLPNDGMPRMLLDLGCGSGLSGEELSDLVRRGGR